MHLVIARATCRPDRREETVQALREVTGPTRQEAGCLSYGFFASIEDPNSFTSVEEWESEEALAAHLGSPHVAALFGTLGETLAAEPEILVHEVARTTGPPA